MSVKSGRQETWRGIVADVRRAATPRGRARLGSYAIEGTRVHERALRAGATPERAVVARGFVEDPDPRVRSLLAGLERAGCRMEVAPDDVVDRLTAGRSIGAIVGLVRFAEPPWTLDRVLERHDSRVRPLLLAALDVEDPGNVGALVRTALASGAAALLAAGISDPYHPRAVRTSMGSVLKLPVLGFESADELLRALEGRGFAKLGAVSRDGTPLPRVRLGPGPVAVFVGSEAFGLGGSTISAMDELVSVPMAPGVDSFSVNAAAAVILYELRGRSREAR